jgi:hypothetical protein
MMDVKALLLRRSGGRFLGRPAGGEGGGTDSRSVFCGMVMISWLNSGVAYGKVFAPGNGGYEGVGGRRCARMEPGLGG